LDFKALTLEDYLEYKNSILNLTTQLFKHDKWLIWRVVMSSSIDLLIKKTIFQDGTTSSEELIYKFYPNKLKTY